MARDAEAQMRAIREKAQKRANFMVRATMMEIANRTILSSPVDTGRFRANWQLAEGSPASAIEYTGDPGQAAQAAITAVVQETENIEAGQVIFLTNNLAYGPRLEDGYSAQAPNGIVKIIEPDIPQIIDAAGRAAVQRFP